MSDLELKKRLLVSYFENLAELNSYAPDEGFEYLLWDDLKRGAHQTQLVENDQAAELVWLAIETDSWVTYSHDTQKFEIIDMDEWYLLLDKRGH